MRLVEQVRRSLGTASSPSPAPATDPEGETLLSQLRREVERIQQRTSLSLHTGLGPESPEMPVGPPGEQDTSWQLHCQDLAPGYRFGTTTLARPDHQLLRQTERLLELETSWDRSQDDPLRPEDLLFFDLETTGLSRAAGTLAFIIGLGRWAPQEASAGGGFQVHQLFLGEPSQEPLVLDQLQSYLERARVLVSFNGRGFDRPVLQNRAMINRTLLDLDHKHHLDLLHLCRRLFRPRTSDCRLGTMEREVLGFDRVGDLPGSEAPRIYNLWLRTGASAELSQLLEHNRLDVALMAPLLTVTTQHAVDPLHWSEDAEELLAAALMHLKGDGESLELAEACLRRGLELAWIPATRRLLLSTLARHLRRTHRPHEASALWEQLRLEFPNHITGWIELAKYHEHVTGDLPRALELAEQSPQQQEGAIQHRLRRLRRRVERAQRSAQRRPRSAGQV